MNLGNPIAKGNTAEIYLCDNKVVKLFKEYLPNTESLYEARKQKYAYSCGLHVPKVFEVTEIQGRQAIIMEYVEGESVGELLLNNLSKAEHYISICVSVQQKIHAIYVRSDEIELMEKRLYRQINSVHDLDEKQKGNILKKLDSITFEPRLCHGDFHPLNLIMSNGDVNIIDWVDASSGDIRADVFRTYLLYSQNSEELAEMYLHIYCKKTGLLRDEIFQWAPIISAARLAESTPL
ncbi:phosphotransferase family protein [Bacillus mycoides]|uniref:phosphotransferase family protein n=1 Tax=Bacillus mycoides TaxID=1405 RepID=UPI0003E256EB|nr:aminoglycoside phosphotransferase family protein [Bacillus mycoides]ETT83622.1 aminoglycoside phosphotransferase [Bacillus mycoides FSL H7-687]MCQ6534312.1 aminoglycoside phosphotransferase family protein [Bacillus mycoides]QWI11239.1 aminoglycoside phosphotransferase family protein [Bacillus mycoides]QWI55697.1 aminoglycoside phosphotransferase family protein [Bacillus mycoides]QWI92294.1 aminoglycoside phosphotransferase family protein [Bacillus mycoides]